MAVSKVFGVVGASALTLTLGAISLVTLIIAFLLFRLGQLGGNEQFSAWDSNWLSIAWGAWSASCGLATAFMLVRTVQLIQKHEVASTSSSTQDAGLACAVEIPVTFGYECMKSITRRGFFITLLLVGVPFVLLWGFPFPPTSKQIGTLLVMGLPAYLVSIIVHELLHAAAAWLTDTVSADQVTFGVRLKEGVVYAHIPGTPSLKNMRIIYGLPGLMLGVLPALIALVAGAPLLALFGWSMLLAACGDAFWLWESRWAKGAWRVRDSPDGLGGTLLVRQDELANIPARYQPSARVSAGAELEALTSQD